MQLTGWVKPSFEDRRELERNIKNLEKEIEADKEPMLSIAMRSKIKELRRLRRMRYLVEEE